MVSAEEGGTVGSSLFPSKANRAMGLQTHFNIKAPPSQLGRALQTEDLCALALLGWCKHSQLHK